MHILLLGSNGRESSIAYKLFNEGNKISVIAKFESPTVFDCVSKSEGTFVIGDFNDPSFVKQKALEINPDLVWVSSDEPLSKGIVDELKTIKGLKVIGPTKDGSEIEWNKVFSIELVKEILPEYLPKFWVIDNENIDSTFIDIQNSNIQIVVKPQGLTGGKGVKVMGKHLADFDEAKKYSLELLKTDEKVLLVELVSGIEFSIMGFTDGVTTVCAPATYDYPYRFDNDSGPGTGGMGSFNDATNHLSFMSEDDFKVCSNIISKTVTKLKELKRDFNGVLYGGFFKTEQGIKFLEFNARLGDPECMNVLEIMDSKLTDLLLNIHNKTLSSKNLVFENKASIVKYLVHPKYGFDSDESVDFNVDFENIAKNDVKTFFSAAIKSKQGFQTVGKSRTLALVSKGESLENAREKIDKSIGYVSGSLEYRENIGKLA